MDGSLKYYRPFLSSLKFHCWGDQCVVYQVESGDTHLLNQVDISILQNINDKPISVDGLLLVVGRLFDGRADQYIQALLLNLAELGLIEAIDNETIN